MWVSIPTRRKSADDLSKAADEIGKFECGGHYVEEQHGDEAGGQDVESVEGLSDERPAQ